MAAQRSESLPMNFRHFTRQFTRISRNMTNGISEFFGVTTDSTDDSDQLLQKWKQRSQQMHANNLILSRRRKEASTSPAPSSTHQIPFSSASTSVRAHQMRSVPAAEDQDRTDFIPHASTYPRLQEPRPHSFRSLRRLRSTPGKSYHPPKRESVLQMTFSGILNAASSKRSKQRHPTVRRLRSFQRANLFSIGEAIPTPLPLTRSVSFFDSPVSTSQALSHPVRTLPANLAKKGRRKKHVGTGTRQDEPDLKGEDFSYLLRHSQKDESKVIGHRVSQHGLVTPVTTAEVPSAGREEFSAGMKRIADGIVDEILDNTDRQVGVGIIGRWLNWDQRTSQIDYDVKKQIDDITSNEHRPFFTYWVTFVQIVCFIAAVSIYGIATVGVSETIIEGEVLTKSLSVERVSYTEEDNMWIGPRQADLIHLGARYSPCMRKDTNVELALFQQRQRENATACCVLNDGSGCYQTDQESCSKTLATWLKWRGLNESQFRFSGSVCGQDPRFCVNPQSLSPFEWPDEIVSWPICRVMSQSVSRSKENRHMTCPVVSRPCCVGIQGKCVVTTREHCTFLRGFFHAELFLCSQISCMSEICAMIPFYNPDQPDQFYRLWTSLFIHAGLFQLVISILFQVFIMRDLEKLAGWLRICIIYVISGIGGSLASAIFVPYHVEAGPSGSQFGLIACLFTDVIHHWKLITDPGWALGKLTSITVVLFILGFLPMIDNYAHLFGFVFGFLLSFALLPYVKFGLIDARNKIIGIVVCLVICVCLLNVLIVLFYVTPIYSCPGCQYFNCIPLTENFCKSMEVKIVLDS